MVQRGAASGSSRSAWAGEIGQTQFMPSTYLKSAVSYGGGGSPDLNHNAADVLASTAAFLPATRLAARRRLGPRRAQLRRHPGVEQEQGCIRAPSPISPPASPVPSEAGYKGGDDDAPAPTPASRRRRDDSMDVDQGGGGGGADDNGGYTAPRRPRVVDPLDEQ